jgi:hypothetical protein
MRSTRGRIGLAAGAAFVVVTAFASTGMAAPAKAAATSTHTPTVTVIARGLNNPRSIAFDEDGNLWVTEAGKGGTECLPTPGEPTNPTCFGLTGSVDKIEQGKVIRVFTGLASLAAQDGSEGLGPAGISSLGDNIYFDIDESSFAVPLGLSPALTAKLTDQLGRLYWAHTDGDSRPAELANVGAYDYEWANQNKNLVPGQFPDADPFGLQVRSHDGFKVFLADAGSNTLDEIGRDGSIHIATFVPNPPSSDAVPTCVAQGPDGALYIGQLTGVGNGAGVANIYRYTPHGGLTVWQTGFSAISGCGFGKDGSFYVTEFDTTGFPPSGLPAGAVIKIARNGTRTTLGAGQLFEPNGFAAGPDGSIYVTNWSAVAGSGPPGAPTGEVVRISG